MKINPLAGRQLVVKADSQDGNKIPAIQEGICQRCGSADLCALPDQTWYCHSCLLIGRVQSDDYLLRIPGQNFSPLSQAMTWQGRLTERQQQISQQLIVNYQKNQPSLVAAVTGAGKTEILFPLLDFCLKKGLRVCLAAPRVDVVEELYPRLQAAFVQIEIGKYHGQSGAEIKAQRLCLCSTHQLLKFYHAFDLLVLDEVDSFPFANNRMLHFAARNAVKKTQKLVFLTATPAANLLEKVQKGSLQLLRLNRRFHGFLLPVPEEKLYLRPFFTPTQINQHLLQEIKRVRDQRHPLLIFVARVSLIPILVNLLQKNLPAAAIAGVHAGDPERLAKVAAFRKQELDILVTTTILERGVTFKHVWVIVLAADDPVFNTASLIQIAGRVGRDWQDPGGLIQFCYHHYTEAISQAVGQIKEMNK